MPRDVQFYSVWQVAVKASTDIDWLPLKSFARENVMPWHAEHHQGRHLRKGGRRQHFKSTGGSMGELGVIHDHLRTMLRAFIDRLNAHFVGNNGNHWEIRIRYTGGEENLDVAVTEARKRALHHRSVENAIWKLWRVFPKDHRGQLSEKTFRLCFLEIFDALAFDVWDPKDREEVCDNDWHQRAEGRPAIDSDTFVESVRTMCDAWGETADEAEYVDFVEALERICTDAIIANNEDMREIDDHAKQKQATSQSDARSAVLSTLGRRNVTLTHLAVETQDFSTSSLVSFVSALRKGIVPHFNTRELPNVRPERRELTDMPLEPPTSVVDHSLRTNALERAAKLLSMKSEEGMTMNGGEFHPQASMSDEELVGPTSATSPTHSGEAGSFSPKLGMSSSSGDFLHFLGSTKLGLSALDMTLAQHPGLQESDLEDMYLAMYTPFSSIVAPRRMMGAFNDWNPEKDREKPVEVRGSPRCRGKITTHDLLHARRLNMPKGLHFSWFVLRNVDDVSSWTPLDESASHALSMSWYDGDTTPVYLQPSGDLGVVTVRPDLMRARVVAQREHSPLHADGGDAGFGAKLSDSSKDPTDFNHKVCARYDYYWEYENHTKSAWEPFPFHIMEKLSAALPRQEDLNGKNKKVELDGVPFSMEGKLRGVKGASHTIHFASGVMESWTKLDSWEHRVRCATLFVDTEHSTRPIRVPVPHFAALWTPTDLPDAETSVRDDDPERVISHLPIIQNAFNKIPLKIRMDVGLVMPKAVRERPKLLSSAVDGTSSPMQSPKRPHTSNASGASDVSPIAKPLHGEDTNTSGDPDIEPTPISLRAGVSPLFSRDLVTTDFDNERPTSSALSLRYVESAPVDVKEDPIDTLRFKMLRKRSASILAKDSQKPAKTLDDSVRPMRGMHINGRSRGYTGGGMPVRLPSPVTPKATPKTVMRQIPEHHAIEKEMTPSKHCARLKTIKRELIEPIASRPMTPANLMTSSAAISPNKTATPVVRRIMHQRSITPDVSTVKDRRSGSALQGGNFTRALGKRCGTPTANVSLLRQPMSDSFF